jgi:hypothetical protein
VHEVVRWRIIDLCQWLWEEYEISVSKQTLSRELRAMGYRKLSARPRHHAQGQVPSRLSKKVAHDSGDNRAGARPRSQQHRGLVCRRGQSWPKEQDHPPLGQARQSSVGAIRPAHRLDLHLRRHLSPQENVWQFVRDNWLSNRVFDDIHALIDHCCDAWNKLEAQPWTIMSLGMRDWAYRF